MKTISIELDDSVHADLKDYVINKSRDPEMTISAFFLDHMKKKVHTLRWNNVTEVQKKTLIDSTGL